MRVELEEAGCLRKLDHAAIDRAVARRRVWVAPRTTVEETAERLHAVCAVLLNTKHVYKLQVNSWGIYVYTNNVDLFSDILAVIPDPNWLNLAQAVVTRAKNTVALKNPQYRYRSYFVSRALSANQKKSISNFLTVNRDTVRASPGLTAWLTYTRPWSQSYYFIDHDDQSSLVMLSLIYPGLIKNTLEIVKS